MKIKRLSTLFSGLNLLLCSCTSVQEAKNSETPAMNWGPIGADLSSKDAYLRFIGPDFSGKSYTEKNAHNIPFNQQAITRYLDTTYGYQKIEIRPPLAARALKKRMADARHFLHIVNLKAASATSRAKSKDFTLASYNMLYERPMGLNRFDLIPDFDFSLLDYKTRQQHLLATVKSFNADVLFFQELSQWLFLDLMQRYPDYIGVFYENQQAEPQGLALLINPRHFDAASLTAKAFSVASSLSNPNKGCLIATLTRNGKKITFGGLHLPYFEVPLLETPEVKKALTADLNEVISGLGDAPYMFLLGDFNITPDLLDAQMNHLAPQLQRSAGPDLHYTCFDNRFLEHETKMESLPVQIDQLYVKKNTTLTIVRDPRFVHTAAAKWGAPQVVLDRDNPSDHLPIVFRITLH
jgi:endonuclease/exonuclease/phosphatase family metal-dependent hydrolase